MAHCPFALLDDLAEVLAQVRAWPGIVEKRPGVFYLRRAAFLHFHLVAGGRRRADVKGRADWIPLDLPRPASATSRRAFLRELRLRYRERGAAAARAPGGKGP